MPRLDENIDALVGAFGTANVGLIWGLANVRWRDAAHRDSFIDIALRLGATDGFSGGGTPRPNRPTPVPMPTVRGEKTVPMRQESMNDPQYTTVNPETGRVEFTSPPSVSV